MSCAPAVHAAAAATLQDFRRAADTKPPVALVGNRTIVPGTCKTCGHHVEYQLWPRDIELRDVVPAARATGRAG